MAKKIVKRRKIKLISIFIFILITIFIYFLIKFSLEFKIQNIYVHNNKYLNDEYIIELAGIEEYPSFILSLPSKLENNLLDSPYIKKASVKKEFLGVINIYIEESEVLFYKEYDKKYVLDNFIEVDNLLYDFSSVRVINYIPDTIYSTFLSRFANIDLEVREKISQIKYDPSEYDDSRFLLYMIDGNYVYITITKMDSLNYYNEIYPTLEGKKGVLYLDSGNHFQAF